MLRSDTTTLFERLREANILLQEVLSGAHENMSDIESTLVTRVSDFVAAMNDVAQKTGNANSEIERNIATFVTTSGQAVIDLTKLAGQFDAHGRSLAEAVALIDTSNRKTEGALSERNSSLEELVNILDRKGSDLDQRLTRFASVLDQSLEGAAERAREIARLTADSTTNGARAIAETFDNIRFNTEEERKRMSQAVHSIYEQATEESNAMFTQMTEHSNTLFTQVTDRSSAMFTHAAGRFAEMLEGLKRMTSEMQEELESTRNELRRGILELPQETADSAAQMRRVIVDQIEALAELNRIVARHGRGFDAVEPAQRRVEVAEAAPRRVAAREEPQARQRRAAYRAAAHARGHRRRDRAGRPGPQGGSPLAQPGTAGSRSRRPHRLAFRSSDACIPGCRAGGAHARPAARAGSSGDRAGSRNGA